MGKVVLGRFKGGNSSRATISPMMRMVSAVFRVSRDLGLLF